MSHRRAIVFLFTAVYSAISFSSIEAADSKTAQPDKNVPQQAVKQQSAQQNSEKQKDPYAWQSLFDGKTLTGWKPVDYGGQGEISVEDGAIELPCGETLTAIVYKGKPPHMNYEIMLEAMRLDGSDFFATTTFPVGKEYCTLVVGGWGGTVVGLSNVDYYDAGDNITTNFFDFKPKRWYRVRLRVSQARIEAWINDEQVVDLVTKGHKFGTRFEVDCCKPLGIGSWCTSAAIRKINVRRLKPEEIAAAAKKRDDE